MEKLNHYWNELKKRPLAYNLVLIVTTVLMLAIVAHILMQIGTRHGSHRTVPDFTGVSYDEATQLADKHNLKLLINDSLYMPSYQGGAVLYQVPVAGVEVKPGRTIYVTVNSFAQKKVVVPYVAGRSLRQAKNMLEMAGLEIKQLVYSQDIATNYVLEEYADGVKIGQGTKKKVTIGSGVTLYVGVNGTGRITAAPKVVGLRLQDAKSRLWEQGINVGKVSFDDGINLLNQKDARVYLQTPSAGKGVTYGTPVDLRLTLSMDKVKKNSTIADADAKANAVERKELEQQAILDSLTNMRSEEIDVETTDGDNFF